MQTSPLDHSIGPENLAKYSECPSFSSINFLFNNLVDHLDEIL